MMLGDDNSIDTLQQLIVEVKKYVSLQKDYARLELTEKLTILLSTMLLVLVVIILGMVALFYLSFTLAYVLAPHVGGLMMSFGIITLFLVVLIACVLAFREALIFRPMVRFVAGVFLADGSAEHEETGEGVQ